MKRLGAAARRNPVAGYTMVEMAIVAAMIAILAAMAVPVARYSLRRDRKSVV